MQKYLIEISYNGKDYKGWQKQPNLNTLQGKIEEKLAIVLKCPIEIFASGRTDAGVHARAQYAHFEYSNHAIDEWKFLYSMNSLLKNDGISINSIRTIAHDFHARFSCISKTYEYQLFVSRRHHVFFQNFCWMIPCFDLQLANECAKLLMGTHDFSSFKDAQCQSKTPIRTIDNCCFFQQNDLIIMQIQARSFLHHQIRIIIGTINHIIATKKTANDFQGIFSAKNRQKAGPTAPAKGLFLSKIVFKF